LATPTAITDLSLHDALPILAVLKDPDSRGGSAWIHQHARPGAILRVRGPRNHFHMDEAHSGHYVFIAGGIGITPVMAMARRAREDRKSTRLNSSHVKISYAV